jgi:hypothetical protein
MEETSSKKVPPIWWTKVINDLEKAVFAAKKSFYDPNIVINVDVNLDDSVILGYLIRLQNGDVGYYKISSIKQQLPVGARIKGKLPKPDMVVNEPEIISYTYEVIRENVLLMPRLWLRKILMKIFNGEPIVMKEDLKAFPEWVLLSPELKKDKALIDILYRVTRYEGLKGLSRFNDKSNNT